MGTAWLLVLLGLLGAALALLAQPVEMAFELSTERGFRGEFSWRWWFVRGQAQLPRAPRKSRVRPSRRRANLERRRRENERKTARCGAEGPDGRPRRKRSRALARGRAALSTPRLPSLVLSFVGRLSAALRPRTLHVHARLGAGDPAATGRLWGALGPLLGALSALLAQAGEADVVVEPDFTEATMSLRAEGAVHFVPLQILGLTLAFLASPAAVRAALRAVRA